MLWRYGVRLLPHSCGSLQHKQHRPEALLLSKVMPLGRVIVPSNQTRCKPILIVHVYCICGHLKARGRNVDTVTIPATPHWPAVDWLERCWLEGLKPAFYTMGLAFAGIGLQRVHCAGGRVVRCADTLQKFTH